MTKKTKKTNKPKVIKANFKLNVLAVAMEVATANFSSDTNSRVANAAMYRFMQHELANANGKVCKFAKTADMLNESFKAYAVMFAKVHGITDLFNKKGAFNVKVLSETLKHSNDGLVKNRQDLKNRTYRELNRISSHTGKKWSFTQINGNVKLKSTDKIGLYTGKGQITLKVQGEGSGGNRRGPNSNKSNKDTGNKRDNKGNVKLTPTAITAHFKKLPLAGQIELWLSMSKVFKGTNAQATQSACSNVAAIIADKSIAKAKVNAK